MVVYLGMLLIVQALSFWFIQDSLNRNARASIHTALVNGERCSSACWPKNREPRTSHPRAGFDYGFRAAVASADQATIESALINHGERIHAHVAIFTDAQFKLKASAKRSQWAIDGQCREGLCTARPCSAQRPPDRGDRRPAVSDRGVPGTCAPDHWLVGMGFKVTDQLLRPERPVRAGSGPALASPRWPPRCLGLYPAWPPALPA